MQRVGGAMLLSSLLLAGFAGAGAWALLQRCTAVEPAAKVETELKPSPDILLAVRDLARLESAQYHIEKVIDLREREKRLFGLVESEDSILLVSAGVDLQQLDSHAIVIEPERQALTIRMPPVTILSSKLDGDKTFVHSRKTDWLTRPNIALESKARQEAERSIRRAALESGILLRARHNAEQTLRALFHSLGFRELRFEWPPLESPS